MVLSDRLKVAGTAIIADELQILGDPTRGASVETLCALLRQRLPYQFVALTATIENPEDVAAWMNCALVRSTKRDVDLFQTIRFAEQLYTVRFGQEEGDTSANHLGSNDLYELIQNLLHHDLGPVLIFTETRREAAEWARAYGERCAISAKGLDISGQLQLFSEPTESSSRLQSLAERGVAFHSADLTPDEKTIIEAGFLESSFQVCFATSTLAAGVNYPFRTVVIPKLEYEYGGREGQTLSRSDYRNMSGRAGRLGYHVDGRVILCPKNRRQLKHANNLVGPENDKVESQLVSLSMRRAVLALISARAVSSSDELGEFFASTFYWHMIAEENPELLDAVLNKARDAIKWLLENGFIEESVTTLVPTPLGKATSISGMLPETARNFVHVLAERQSALNDSFGDYEVPLIHWIAASPEFMGKFPSRFLPYASGPMRPECAAVMQQKTPLVAVDRSDNRLMRCVYSTALFIEGEAERKIQFKTGISSGQTHRLAVDMSWVMDGLGCITSASELQCPQTLTNQLNMLARRIRWGVPVEAMDVLRVARFGGVPGFGRQRVMALVANGICSVADVIAASKEKLNELVGGRERAEKLLNVLSDRVTGISEAYQRIHMELGRELGIENKIAACNQSEGVEYENAIVSLLREERQWVVACVDDGKRQNVPDLRLSLGDVEVLIECKTVSSRPLLNKESAFAILQKAIDFDSTMRRVTLGKPDFDELSKRKAAASSEVTLISHGVFMEAVLRVLTGRLAAGDFVKWLIEPGVADLNRLPGVATYIEQLD